MKRVVLFVLALLLTVSASAKFGITGGLTTAQTKTSFSDLKTAKSFHAGITYEVPLVLGFAIQPSLMFNQKRETLQPSLLYDNEYKMSGIELPVQVQWGINIGKVIRPYIFAEPFVGYVINVKESDGAGKWTNIPDMSSFNRWEYGVGVGGGIKLFEHLQVSARYYWNLEPPFKNLKENLTKDKCRGLRVTAAILF